MRRPATRQALRVRCGIDGAAGAGKTYSALLFARGLVGVAGKITVIDTERGRSEQYAGMPGIGEFTVDLLEPPHTPARYVAAIGEAVKAGDEVVIIDSLTHAWTGTGGVLQMVEGASGMNQYTRWRTPSAEHQRLIDAIVQAPIHVVCTMRSKMAYELIENERGKKEPVRLGLAPVQREGTEYEFDIVFDIDQSTHTARLAKCNTSYSSVLATHLLAQPIITNETGAVVVRSISGVEPTSDLQAHISSLVSVLGTDALREAKGYAGVDLLGQPTDEQRAKIVEYLRGKAKGR